MSGPISLKAPTIDQLEDTSPKMLFLDPRKDSEKGPEAVVSQAEITATVDKQPSRITNLGVNEAGEQIDLREEYREKYGGDTTAGKAALAAGDFLDNSLGGVARGINDFVAGIGDFALNNIDNALTAAGIVNEDTIDRDFLRRVVNSNDFEAQRVIIPYLLMYGEGERVGSTDKDSIVERYGRAAGKEVAIAVPFVAMQMKLAQLTKYTAGAVNQATQGLQRDLATRAAPYIDRVVGGFRSAPATMTALELGGAGLAGVGMEAEENIFGTNTGLGGLTAVFAPFYLASKIGPTVNAFKWFGKPAVTMADDALVKSGVVSPGGGRAQTALEKQIAEAKGTDAGAKNWSRAKEIITKLNQFAPDGTPVVLTPAEQTMDAPFLASQAKLEGTGDANFTRNNLNRKFNVLESISNFKNYLVNGRNSATVDAPLYVYDEATNSYTKTIGQLDADGSEIAYQLNTLSSPDDGVFPLMTDKASTGGAVRQDIIAAKVAAKEAAEILAKKLKINSADQLASNDSLVSAQDKLRSSVITKQGDEALSFRGLHPMVKEFLNTKLQRISFQDWKTFSGQTSDALGSAIAKGNSDDIRTLTSLKETLDNMGASYGRTSEKFAEFQTIWRETVIEPFTNGWVSKVIAGPGGVKGYTLAPEKVGTAFLTDTNSARAYLTLYADNPDKIRFIRNAALDKVRKAGMDKNGLNADKLNAHLNTNRDVYTELGFFEDFSNSTKLVSDILARNAELDARKKLVNSNLFFSSVAKSMKNNNPESLFEDAIRNPAIMKELKAVASKGSGSLSAEESLEVFRGAVMNKLFSNYQGKDVFSNPKAFKQMIVDNETSLNAAFDKKHLDNIYLVADAVERIMQTGLPKGAGVTDTDMITALTNKLGTTPAGISNRFIAVQEGRLGPRAAVGYIASRFLRQESGMRTEALFKEMMFNPAIADDLVAKAPRDLSVTPQVQRRINTYLFNVGIEAIGASPDFDPNAQQEIKFGPPDIGPQGSVSPEILPSVESNRFAAAPINNSPAPAPVASANQQQTQTASASDLFPFDPTLAAIEKRQNAKQGIMSVA